jgi:hypothetical protein
MNAGGYNNSGRGRGGYNKGGFNEKVVVGEIHQNPNAML